jgi:hypothetical protein
MGDFPGLLEFSLPHINLICFLPSLSVLWPRLSKMSSSSSEPQEERMTGSSFVQSTVKIAIRALSSVRFPTPVSSAQKRNDAVGYDDAGKSARVQSANELRFQTQDDKEPPTSGNFLPESMVESELAGYPCRHCSVLPVPEQYRQFLF